MNPTEVVREPIRSEKSFQRIWYLKLNDPITSRALWLRFSILSSQNGFSRIAEMWAVYFERISNREVKKTAVKQTFPIQAYSNENDSRISIGGNTLTENQTRGCIQSKGNSIEWDLSFISGRPSSFSVVPKILARTKLVKGSMITSHEELFFSGTLRINNETIKLKDCPGMQGNINGLKNSHSWIWGHCNTFVDSDGKFVPFIFEGLTVRGQMGPLTSPRVSSFFFSYLGEDYTFNTLRDSIHIRSSHTLNEWTFRVDRQDLSFRGNVQADHKDFIGLTFEDTRGGLLYCANSKLANMRIFIYRKGKLEASFFADGTAALEIASREKNPYVPTII